MRTLNELNERLKVGIRTFGPNRSYTSKRTAPCFFRERQGAVLCCLVKIRTMKRLSFNRTHRIQSKSSSPIALIVPKRSDHSRTHSYRTCMVGLFRTRFLRALSHANFRNARPIGLSQACLTSKLFRVHSYSTSHKSLHGKPERAYAAQAMSRFCKKWQEFAVVNGLGTPKRPQRYFVFAKPQVTIYRRQEQCTPYRAQPQICAKKLTIRTKYQARANCSRRHQQ